MTTTMKSLLAKLTLSTALVAATVAVVPSSAQAQDIWSNNLSSQCIDVCRARTQRQLRWRIMSCAKQRCDALCADQLFAYSITSQCESEIRNSGVLQDYAERCIRRCEAE